METQTMPATNGENTNEKAPLSEGSALYNLEPVNTSIPCSDVVKPPSVATGSAKIRSMSRWFNLKVNSFDFRYTDAGNADLFVALFSQVVRYNSSRDKWFCWNGHFWEANDKSVNDLIVYATDFRIAQAEKERFKGSTDDERKASERKYEAAVGFATSCQNLGKIKAVRELVSKKEPITTDEKEWNTNPNIIAFNNGVLDLKTFAFRPGRQSDMISKCVPRNYNVNAKCTEWEKFVEDVLPDSGLRNFVHKALGYSLLGGMTEQFVLFCVGKGSNGKSTLLNTVLAVLGDYADSMDLGGLDERNSGGIPNDIAALAGKRFIVAAETKSGSRFNEAKIKYLTGERFLRGRFLNKEYFTFENQMSLWISVNHLPQVQDNSDGYWRRAYIVPFNQKFKKVDEERGAGDKLINPLLETETFPAEYDGIVRWLVDGCKLYRAEGLQKTAEMQALARQYREANDNVANFIDDCCIVESGARVGLTPIRKAFAEWCKDNRVPPLNSARQFKESLESRGFTEQRNKRMRYFEGIGLAPDGTPPESDTMLG